MGIRDTVKKLVLPIIGQKPAAPPPRPAPRASSPARDEEEQVSASPRGDKPVNAYIEEVVKGHPVVLFMKGSPASPLCGFSANAAGILSSYGKPFHTVDVISDPEVREGVKAFTKWPTIPQIFIGGEFVGGADILGEMNQNGELKEALEKAYAGAPS